MDYEIIAKVKAGEVEEFNLLIEKYYREIFKFVHNQFDDLETTKDIVQEIFMRIYANLNKYNKKKATFRTWIYRISNNYCINYMRNNKNHDVKGFNLDSLKLSEDCLRDLVIKEDAKYVIHIMKKNLSKRNYKMLILHFFSDLNQTEIAEVFNIAPKTVRNVVSISIKSIRAIVRSEYND